MHVRDRFRNLLPWLPARASSCRRLRPRRRPPPPWPSTSHTLRHHARPSARRLEPVARALIRDCRRVTPLCLPSRHRLDCLPHREAVGASRCGARAAPGRLGTVADVMDPAVIPDSGKDNRATVRRIRTSSSLTMPPPSPSSRASRRPRQAAAMSSGSVVIEAGARRTSPRPQGGVDCGRMLELSERQRCHGRHDRHDNASSIRSRSRRERATWSPTRTAATPGRSAIRSTTSATRSPGTVRPGSATTIAEVMAPCRWRHPSWMHPSSWAMSPCQAPPRQRTVSFELQSGHSCLANAVRRWAGGVCCRRNRRPLLIVFP